MFFNLFWFLNFYNKKLLLKLLKEEIFDKKLKMILCSSSRVNELIVK